MTGLIGVASGLTHMSIKGYAKDDFSGEPAATFEVQINPASYTRSVSLIYCDANTSSDGATSPRFQKVQSDTLSFELVMDATGAVPAAGSVMASFAQGNRAGVLQAFKSALQGPPKNGVEQWIIDLKKVILDVDSETHQPRFVLLSWGELKYRCRLEQMNTTYTLFRPDGVAVRAKMSLSFREYTNIRSAQAEADTHSPDLTHLVTVSAGESLPLLCERIYGRPELYLRIADFNGLSGFRSLRPGMQLLFPPLTSVPA